MYYESDVAVNRIRNCINAELQSGHEESNQTIVYVDLNHCSASGPNTKDVLDYLKEKQSEMKRIFEKDKEKQKVIVFDYTSATTRKLRQAIELFAPYVEVLLLVSSGVKNEQIGADTNTYGTLRLISADRNKINHLDSMLKLGLGVKEALPHESHCVRRLYKSVRAVITTKDICNAIGWHYSGYNKSANQADVEQLERYDYQETIEKFIEISFFDIYKDEMVYIGLNDSRYYSDGCFELGKYMHVRVLGWDDQKIRYLFSENISHIVENGGDFHIIEKCYDRNRERLLYIIKCLKSVNCLALGKNIINLDMIDN